MGILDNKYIPMLDSTTYTIDIIPKKIDPTGRIRTPEEIKNGTIQFVHTIYIDTIGNIYLIPLKYEKDSWIDYFTPQDIIKAGLGDMQAKLLLEKSRAEIKEKYKKDLLNDAFIQKLYDKEKDSILENINKHRLESPKTITNFKIQELMQVFHTALPI